MRLAAAIQRAAWSALALAGAVAAAPATTAAPASGVPAVLREAALPSAKALGAATFAVARAGDRLVAAGERGAVLLSDDGGTQWRQARQVPVRVSLVALRFVDEKVGWAAGHLGSILKTEDGGETWTLQFDGRRAADALAARLRAAGDERATRLADRLQEEGPDKPFFDIEFLDAQRGVAVGAYNLALATADGGKTWTPISERLPNPKNLHLHAVRAVDGRLLIAGEQGLLLQSTDGGASFQPLASPYKGSWFGLLAARSGTLLAYGLRGHVFRSTDRGASWQKVDAGVPVSITAATELDGGALALLTQTGDVLVSDSDGSAFKRQLAVAPLPASGLAVAPDGRFVIASLRGVRRQSAP